MKEVIIKGKLAYNLLPKHLILNNRNIFDQKTIANSFNEYFVNAGLKLAGEIPQSQRLFEMYLKECDSSFEEVTLSDEEIKTAFFSLKGGKSPGFDETINDKLPTHICTSMLFKNASNRLYKYITESDLLYCKQFGFQKRHSLEHAILQLVEQIHQSFEKNEFALGVFVDLSKAFDIVDHQILLKKLEYYGITGNNLRWFENYLKD